MRFQTPDGEVFEGHSYRAIVEQMADMKMASPRSLRSYRQAAARRVADAYNDSVDASTNKTFVKGLVEVGLLFRTN